MGPGYAAGSRTSLSGGGWGSSVLDPLMFALNFCRVKMTPVSSK
jgi:hypothetical protein